MIVGWYTRLINFPVPGMRPLHGYDNGVGRLVVLGGRRVV